MLLFLLIINTFCKIIYTFDVNDVSNKLYREISKNFTIQHKSQTDKQFQLNPKCNLQLILFIIINTINSSYIFSIVVFLYHTIIDVKRVELVLREKYGGKPKLY